MPGRASTSPRASPSTSPARFTAVRVPAAARSTGSPCTCRPRTRARRPEGSASTSSPVASSPATSVPVTTVPKPFIEKTRSTGSRSSPVRRPRRGLAREGEEGLAQRGQALPRPGGDADERGGLQEGPGHELARLELGDRLAVRVGRVALREHDQAAGHAEEPADVEVLPGLGHHRLVGGHHQRHRVDAVRPRQHVADEALVARHVHERGHHPVPQLAVGEAEVDRDAALLLLLQPVGIGAGERAHERALPVVDVAGRPDDEGAQGRVSPRGWSPRRPTPRSCAAWRRGRAGPPSPRGR